MNFNEQYKKYLSVIGNRIEKYFESFDYTALQKNVFEAMKYAICGGGKRIRPVLTLAVSNMLGGLSSNAEYVALAVECVHNYSLIHDDLPCMDNDDLRRGRATCHKVYGEDIALLAGDGLLNTAFEILSADNGFESLSPSARLEIIRCLSGASGVLGMIGGQVVDLQAENRSDITADELLYLHKNKTGALIRAAVRCGAICGGADSSIAAALDEYAESLGLAFQIKDDILDVVGCTEVLGKPIGSDADCGKSTFVTLFGLDGAKDYLVSETNKAKVALEPLGEKARFLSELADFLLNRNV